MNLKDPSLLRQACLIGGQWTEADDKSVMTVANKATGETIGSVPGQVLDKDKKDRKESRSLTSETKARTSSVTAEKTKYGRGEAPVSGNILLEKRINKTDFAAGIHKQRQ